MSYLEEFYMKCSFLTVLVAACLIFGKNASADTVLQCAVNKVPTNGVRVNLMKSVQGQMRANLIFGTTVSGTIYNVTEVKPGIYQGSIKSNEQFWIKLSISSTPAENSYIRGYKSSVQVVYPDLRKSSGFGTFNSVAAEEFTCGKKINSYGN
jgi:hypothetical protein